jgi:hypothetical protein
MIFKSLLNDAIEAASEAEAHWNEEAASFCSYDDEEARVNAYAKAEEYDKLGASLAELQASWVVIFYGDDGEPDVRCVTAGTAGQAVAKAWKEFLDPDDADEEEEDIDPFEMLHGVYPGFIDERVEL